MGCPRRALDASKLENYFLSNGFTIAKNPNSSDYILFITCAFRKNEEDFAIRRIQQLTKYRGELIIGGCLKGINRERLNKNFNGESFTSSNIEYIDELFPDFKTKFHDLPDSNILSLRNKLQIFREYFFALRFDISFLKRLKVYWEKRVSRQYYYLRIGWGCVDHHCAFCVIWRAIGKLKSKPPDICVNELGKALGNGYKNIIIIADNPGAYGVDINMTFVDLLNKLLEVEGDYNIEIEGLHPFWLIKYLDGLISLFQSSKIKLMLCPVQSGNSRILKLMNRRHDAFQLKEALLKVRRVCPQLKLHTHIIVGFPSETEEEFQESLNLVRDVGIDLVKIYGYTKNCSTTNLDLLTQEIPATIIQRRMKKAMKWLAKNRIACATA